MAVVSSSVPRFFIRQGVKTTTLELVKGACEGHEVKGVPGAVGGVLKQVPGVALQPFIILPGAASNLLDGVKNQLAPDKRKETEDKWKPDDL